MKVAIFGLVLGLLAHSAWAQSVEKSEYPVTMELSDIKRPARAAGKATAYRGPILDALLHMDPGFDSDKLPPVLNENGVRRAVIMPVPNESRLAANGAGTAQKIQFAQKYPKRFKVMCGGDYLSNWISESARFGVVESSVKENFSRLAADLSGAWCLGVGEFGLFHFSKLPNQNVIETPYNHPLVLEMVDIVASHRVWLHLHAEPREPNGRSREKEVWAALMAWTQRQPTLKIILSHSGMTSAANARRILETFPNVYMTFKVMPSKASEWSHLEPIANEDLDLYEDWAALMEEKPERFMVGTDAKFGMAGYESQGTEAYSVLVKKFRRVLGSLSPRAATLIATKNAEKLYGFKPNAPEEMQGQ